LRVLDPGANAVRLPFFLRQLHGSALRVARVRHLHRDLHPFIREIELFLGLVQGVGGLAQLFLRDEPPAQQRLQLLVLVAKPVHLFLCELKLGPDFVDGQRAVAFGHALDVRDRLLALALGRLQVKLCLPQLLLNVLFVAPQLARVEARQQIALAHVRTFRDELHDFCFPADNRRVVRERLDGSE